METPTREMQEVAEMNNTQQISNADVNQDRLSNLPEPILHHILSFLEMRFVTPTSLLSKKWRYLYKSLPFLTFDRADLLLHITFRALLMRRSLDKNSIRNIDAMFIQFVNRVLRQSKNSTIQSFRLYWGSDLCHSSHIDSWLRIVIECNVQEIDVQISTEDACFMLPDSLYNSKSLRILKLVPGSKYPEQRIIIPRPDFVNLPVLGDLSLTKINCVSDEFLEVYFSGCPVLERLTLIECDMDDSYDTLNFSAPQLKHLVIEILDLLSWSRKRSKHIVISAPNIVSFTCKDYVSHNYCLENLSMLEVANIQMRTVERDYNDDSDMDAPAFTKEDAKRMTKLLKGLYNVKYLTVNHTFLEVISDAPEVLERSYIPFSNLRYLKVITWIGKPFLRSIVYLLENSPNIETLILEINLINDLSVNISEYWGEEMVLVETLKVIQIWNNERCFGHFDPKPERLKEYLKYQVDLLKMFLKHAVKLEKMSIFSCDEWDEEAMECFEEEILACPRASSDVKILFREIQNDENCW